MIVLVDPEDNRQSCTVIGGNFKKIQRTRTILDQPFFIREYLLACAHHRGRATRRDMLCENAEHADLQIMSVNVTPCALRLQCLCFRGQRPSSHLTALPWWP